MAFMSICGQEIGLPVLRTRIRNRKRGHEMKMKKEKVQMKHIIKMAVPGQNNGDINGTLGSACNGNI